jgi:hypothetical protein
MVNGSCLASVTQGETEPLILPSSLQLDFKLQHSFASTAAVHLGGHRLQISRRRIFYPLSSGRRGRQRNMRGRLDLRLGNPLDTQPVQTFFPNRHKAPCFESENLTFSDSTMKDDRYLFAFCFFDYQKTLGAVFPTSQDEAVLIPNDK